MPEGGYMQKVKKMLSNLPKWNTPSPGNYLTLKEWMFYIVGGMGAYGAGAFIQFVTLSAGIYVAAALNIDVMHITYIGLLTSAVTIITSPLVSWMIDNTNSKYGKFRPYLIWLPIPIIICYFALGQVVSLFSSYTAMLVAYAIVFNILNFLNRIYTLAFSSIIQVMTPVTQERTNLMSIGTFFTSLGPTLASMIYPIIANRIYADGEVSGVNKLGAIQWIVPILASVFLALGLLVAFGVKERMVLPKEFKNKQKFSQGIKKTFENKYFWITNISAVLGSFRAVSTGFTLWIIVYIIYPSFIAKGRETAAAYLQTIIVTIIGDACVPGMLLAPWLIKKFGKKNLIIFTYLGATVATAAMVFLQNPYALLAMIYLVTLFNGLQVVTSPSVQSEIYDYQQYKTGDRLEGFLSQFGTMIVTIAGMLFAFVTPAVYKRYGYTNDTQVLYNTDVLFGIIRAMCIIGTASGILSTIPYFFYDLSEKQHGRIMQILRVRANRLDGLCDDQTAKELENRIKNGEENVLDYFEESETTVPPETL